MKRMRNLLVKMKLLLVLLNFMLLFIVSGYGMNWPENNKVIITLGHTVEQTFLERTIAEHTNLTIICRFAGNTIWYKNNEIFLNNRILYFPSLRATDAATYSCNTKTAAWHGFKWANITLHVEKEHIFNVSLLNETLIQGDSMHLKCEIAPKTATKYLIWLKLDATAQLATVMSALSAQLAQPNVLENELSLPAHAQRLMVNTTEHVLPLNNVQPTDESWYICIAGNDKAANMSAAYVKVLMLERNAKYSSKIAASKSKHSKKLEAEADLTALDTNSEDGPPKFKRNDRLDDYLMPAGSSLDLRCPAIGNPMPNITWTRNDTEINRRIGTVKYNKWFIKMDDLITDDSGVYKCIVCNKYGCIEDSSKVTIIDRLRSPPIQSDKFPQNQTVLVNSTAVFECKVVSDLEPFIYWIKYTHKNASIRELEKIVTTNDSNNTKDFIELGKYSEQPSVLRLNNVTHTDEGWYTCVAANSLGRSVASGYLKVLDKWPNRELHTILRSHPYLITVMAIVIVSLFVLGIIFIIYVLRKLKHEKLLKQRIQTVHQWTKKVIIYKPYIPEGSTCDLQMPMVKIEKKRTTFQTTNGMDSTQAFNEYEFPLDSDWEISRSSLTLGDTLGEGAFGRVVRAEATNLMHHPTGTTLSSNNNYNNKSQTTIVAVKMVKEEHTDADMASLVREMEVMKIIGKHVNIINLLGCCSRSDGPLWVIVEYALHGNLKDFLKKHRPLSLLSNSASLQRNSGYLEEKPLLTDKTLVSFAFQVARGMEYLASRRCIHRDLAARNVLVSDDYVMKIADFGLARDLQDTDYYRKNSNGRLPIKWMAPESLQDKFYDSKSDVWSYGVLLWEIMSYGDQPYAQLMSAEELYSYLISGQRMKKPARCSLNIYLIMRQCWHFESEARPTFSELVEYLEKIYQSTNTAPNEEYLDLSIPMLETPPSSSDEADSETETFLETSPLRYQYTYKFN